MSVHDLKVLLVEDDQNVSATICNMLKEMGVSTIYEAEDGDVALEIWRDPPESISLVICDWNMPGKTGVQVLQAVRESNKDIPFLMVTARADKESVIEAKESGVTGYICKPFSFSELKKKVFYIDNRWGVN